MHDLLDTLQPARAAIGPGAMVLRGRAVAVEHALLAAVAAVSAAAPFRRMTTPGGFEMSAAMTNCGGAGWVTDRRGYRYGARDPETDKNWPAMPDVIRTLAADAADEAGYPGFVPDACLINRYQAGSRLSLHQDKDERDFAHPIVSVSLGLPIAFQFGGPKRTDPVKKIALSHGDVVVWGGPSRLFYHGVLALKEGDHPLTGSLRYNLTLRKAL